jgi:hypothetical protein
MMASRAKELLGFKQQNTFFAFKSAICQSLIKQRSDQLKCWTEKCDNENPSPNYDLIGRHLCYRCRK